MFPLDISPIRFTCSNAIRHWSNGCHNKNRLNKLSQIRYSLVVILELNGVSEVQYKEVMIIDNE